MSETPPNEVPEFVKNAAVVYLSKVLRTSGSVRLTPLDFEDFDNNHPLSGFTFTMIGDDFIIGHLDGPDVPTT